MLRRLCVAVCLLLVDGFARAATLNVGQAGSGAPYTSIQAAINAAQNGDTIMVAPGTYTEHLNFNFKAITVQSSGGATVTTIDATNTGRAVIIGTNTTGGAPSLIDGFTIQNGLPIDDSNALSYGSGVIIVGNAVVESNTIQNNSSCGVEVRGGVTVVVRANSILNNIVDTVSGTQLNATCSGTAAGILAGDAGDTSGFSPTLLIQGNLIQGNAVTGITILDSSSSFFLTIANNIIQNQAATIIGPAIDLNVSTPTLIANNLIINNPGGGITGGLNTLTSIVNNTLSNNGGLTEAFGLVTNEMTLSGSGTIANNIIYDLSSTTAPVNLSAEVPWLIFDHNDVYMPNYNGKPGTNDVPLNQYGNRTIDPQFKNAAGGDFHLLSSSPNIDSGNNSAANFAASDLDGNPRLVDATGVGYPIIDLGVYEASGSKDANPTTLQLVSSSYEINFDSSVTLTLQTTSLNGIPTGMVTFTEDGTAVGSMLLDATGKATMNVSPTTPGLHYFTATYPGQGTFTPATSLVLIIEVDRAKVTLSLTSSSNPSLFGQPLILTTKISSVDTNQLGPIVLTDGSTTLATLSPDATGTATFTTSNLTLGNHILLATYTGDATHLNASAGLLQQVISGFPTTTTITSSGSPSTSGQSVTFTSQVTTSATGQGTPAGSIVFSYGSTVLGTVVMDATGSASVSTSVLPIGSDVITATYQSSDTFLSSSNTTTQMVQGLPQTIIFPQLLPPAYMGTSVLLAATASSGLPVTYSVVSGPATVSGAVLTYTGVGNVVVEADQVGDATYASAPAVQSLPIMTKLLSESVGTVSGSVTTVVTFSSAGALGSVAVLTQGAAGLDFAQVTGGSCAVGTTYAVGQNCTVEFSFTPTRPGQRYGGIVLSASAGAMLANSYVYGVGVGPQIGWLPGTQTLVGSGGLNSPSGVAVDGSGNVFVSEYGGGLAEIVAGGAQRTLGSFGVMSDVAVDGSGNVFVMDATSVYEVMAINGVMPASPTIVTLATGFSQLNGIAVDGTGNVFLANGAGTDGEVYELAAVNGVIPSPVVPRTLGSGFKFVTGVAVDANGNVFASDEGNQAVYEIEAVNGVIGASPVIRALGGTFQSPSNVGLDAANDVYVTDYISGIVSEFMAVNGSVPANPVIRTVGSGIIEPQGMVVDGNGNIFIADEAVAQVVKLDYADPPSLTFATTAVGSVSSDSPQTVTISNDGNAPLAFTIPTSGTNASITPGFTIGSGSTCPQSTNATTTAPQLATGASCTEAISFAPVLIGADSGKMVVTDDAVDLAQTVLLNGVGTTPTTTVLQSSLNPAGVGVSVMFTATVTSPAGTPTGSVTFTDGTTTLGSGTLTGGVATFSTSSLTMGTHTITATYTGASDFEQSTASLMQTIGYQSVTTTSVSPEPSSYGQPVVFTVHVAGAAGSIGTPSGGVLLEFCHGAQIPLTLDANGNASVVEPQAGTISEPVGSCPYTANYLGDAAFFPSVSSSTPYVVNPATSTTTVSGAPNPGYVGQAVTLTAQVAGVGSPTLGPGGVILQPGSLVATGTVQFYDGATPIGSASALSGAQTASVVTTTLALGSHTITAKYTGDANLSGSTSVGVNEVIEQPGTATTLIVSPNPGVQYQTETMLVSVAALAGLAPPFGQVVIYDGATPIATLPLSSVNGTVASATYTTSTLAVGTHVLVAKYSVICVAVVCEVEGFAPSQSLPVSLLIQPQDFTITANPPSITIQTEHHASMPLMLTAIGQFDGPIYLSCAGAVPKWVTCEFPNSPVTLMTPSGVQPTGGTTGPVPQATATFTIDTDALLDYKSETRGVSSRVVWAGLFPVMLLGFVRRRKLRGLVVVAMVSVMAMAMTACSGQYPAHTVPGTYTVTVQASGQVVGASAPTVHTLDVTLVVTP